MSLPPYLCDGNLSRRRPLPVPVTAVSLAVARLRSKPLRGPLGTAPRGAVLLVRSTVLQPPFHRLVVRCCLVATSRLLSTCIAFAPGVEFPAAPLHLRCQPKTSQLFGWQFCCCCFVGYKWRSWSDRPAPPAHHNRWPLRNPLLCFTPLYNLTSTCKVL
jgi:hypothetical protein